PKRAAQLLVDAANAAGGEDNVTAVIIEAVEVPGEVDAEPAVPDHDTSEIPPLKPRRRRGRSFLRSLPWVLPIPGALAIAVLARIITVSGYILVALSKGPSLPPNI